MTVTLAAINPNFSARSTGSLQSQFAYGSPTFSGADQFSGPKAAAGRQADMGLCSVPLMLCCGLPIALALIAGVGFILKPFRLIGKAIGAITNLARSAVQRARA